MRGSLLLAGFVASATSYTVVMVAVRGCGTTTNATLTRDTVRPADPIFRTDLLELVPVRRRVRAVTARAAAHRPGGRRRPSTC